tara:strand:+ start:870 stop:986 length:117 start_codon:yes stop_codon:yes gene_type:complete
MIPIKRLMLNDMKNEYLCDNKYDNIKKTGNVGSTYQKV